MKKNKKLFDEIYKALFAINETVVYYLHDEKEITNSVCRNLRKISKRLDKIEKSINNQNP